jgi:hypothetical protein
MSLRRLRQRLRESGRRLRAGTYACLARCWNAGVRPEQEHVVEQLFRNLVDGEVHAGTRLESLLARLPREMDMALRRALHRIVVEQDGRSAAGHSPRTLNADGPRLQGF